MTIAFNLSQLANYVNSSGKVDASAGLVNASPVANGGTGRASQTAYAVLCGGTTTTAAQQSIASVGTTGQVLTSNGAGALPTFQAATGSAIATIDVKTTGTSATWTIPAGVTKVRITVVGGGGDGSVGTAGRGGGGAGGGGTAIKVLTGLTAGNTLTYTVGGAGATSQVASGTQTITTISATAGSTVSSESGGAGGIGSNGDLNVGGGGGSAAVIQADYAPQGGTGGSSYLGGGGYTINNGGSGNAGRQYGGGGSGGCGSGVGAGAAGVIIFEY
jgi:hypothetical protein